MLIIASYWRFKANMSEKNRVARFCFAPFEALLRDGAEQMTGRTNLSVFYSPPQYEESIVDAGGMKWFKIGTRSRKLEHIHGIVVET